MPKSDIESNEDDLAESYSKSDDETEKVDTCVTNSENEIAELYDESEKCGTNTTNSENETAELYDEPEKCGTNTTNSENTLADFIHEHYFDLESIFNTYISMTDNDDEVKMLEEFQKLLYQTKEVERNKIRFSY